MKDSILMHARLWWDLIVSLLALAWPFILIIVILEIIYKILKFSTTTVAESHAGKSLLCKIYSIFMKK